MITAVKALWKWRYLITINGWFYYPWSYNSFRDNFQNIGSYYTPSPECVWVHEREWDRERERVCVCVYLSARAWARAIVAEVELPPVTSVWGSLCERQQLREHVTSFLIYHFFVLILKNKICHSENDWTVFPIQIWTCFKDNLWTVNNKKHWKKWS